MKIISGLFLTAVCHIAFSQTAAELLQSKLNTMQSMSASFSQVVRAKTRTLSRSSGTMALQRPGRFRWLTKSPLEQLVVADGINIWVYDKDLEQVTVKKQKKGLGGTAALFLSGYNDTLTKDFEVTQNKRDSNIIFDLKSRSARANFQRMKLVFLNEELQGLDLYDQLGQITSVKFNQIKSNPKLSPNTFVFKVPKGVDVIRQ